MALQKKPQSHDLKKKYCSNSLWRGYNQGQNKFPGWYFNHVKQMVIGQVDVVSSPVSHSLCDW